MEIMQVSWIRRRDWHIMSVGETVYTSDDRVGVTRKKDSTDWQLQFKFAYALKQFFVERANHFVLGLLSVELLPLAGDMRLFLGLLIFDDAKQLLHAHHKAGVPLLKLITADDW